MNKEKKSQLVEELTDRIRSARALYYTDFTGLNVKSMTDLRRRMRRAGVEYVVIKNTLALRAIGSVGLEADRLRGPTGIVVSNDPVGAAKLLADFAREHEQRPGIKGGMLDGARLDQAQVKRLATMLSREQMLAELGASMQNPMAGFVGALNGLLSMFAGALESLHQQRQSA